MREYGKKEAWRGIGFNCLKYGILVTVFGVITAVMLGMETSVMHTRYLLENPFYSISLGMAVLTLYILSYIKYDIFRTVRDFSPTVEGIIAATAFVGLTMPLTAIGILLIIVTIPEYSGIEKWLPDIKNRSHYELSELQRVTAELELSQNVKERSEVLIERLRNYDLFSGRSFNSMLGGVIYIAAREEEEPRTLDEISEAVREDKREIGKAYRYIGRQLDIRILPPDPVDFIERFTGKLGLENETALDAEQIVKDAAEQDLISGKSSKGIAAAAIYISAYKAGEPRSLNEMSNVLSITTVTIRERAKDLVQGLGIQEAPENLEDGG